MQYAILSGRNCSYTCHGLTLHPITPLFADICLFESHCTWTARTCKECDYANVGLAAGCDIEGLQCGFPCNADNLVAGNADESVDENCEISHNETAVKSDGEYAQWYPPVIISRTNNGANSELQWHPMTFNCCYSNKLLIDNSVAAGDADAANGSGAWYDFYGLTYDQAQDRIAYVENCTSIAWKLVVTSATTATLTGYYTDSSGYYSGDFSVVYECTAWNCLDRSSFRMTSNDYQECAFPESLCITPYSSCWQTHCSSPAAACNCCDPGNIDAYFEFDGFGTCLTEPATILITRNATLPSGVTNPAGACGYFWGSTEACDGVTIGELTWCDGTDWHASLYCSTDGGTTFTELCTSVGTMTECCPGNVVTYECTVEDFGDCCCASTVTTTCCESGVPTTLYADLDLNGCDTLGGGTTDLATVELTYNGGDSWIGTVVSSDWGMLTGCGELTVTFRVDQLLVPESPSCYQYLEIASGGNTCYSDDDTTLVCPFTSASFSATWDNFNCTCCFSGTMTVTVYP